MKLVFIFISFLPLWLAAQTVHLDDKKIEYKGDVKLEGISQTEIFNRAKNVLQNVVKPVTDIAVNEKEQELKTIGVIRLPTPYPIIRNLCYTLKFSAKKDGYHYKIEDVSIWEKHRGEEGHFISPKDIVDKMDDPGVSTVEAEHTLNAIDLNLQKMLALIKNKMKE